jgi:hypothetical protein
MTQTNWLVVQETHPADKAGWNRCSKWEAKAAMNVEDFCTALFFHEGFLNPTCKGYMVTVSGLHGNVWN